ncbi:MAG TPA: ATP-dependent DNA helicase [Victivallales bacterium]|nr:ATP-dependent DNA helicase [Victivallales bacterium]HPO91543.1 ATP-dependent DNA helicase [Victivallales bacterium]
MIKLSDSLTDIQKNTEIFFGDNSPLKESQKFGAPQYEERPQQRKMAIKIAEAFETNKNLCIEAPTGIGKSYAYLVPAVYLAKSKKIPVIISTETINLQEQLIFKDVPILQLLIKDGFKATLAKGRSHYVCLRRLCFSIEKTKEELFEEYIQNGILKIYQWVRSTGIGDRSQADFSIDSMAWYHVACEPGNCIAPKCPNFKDCFYWKARKEWETSDIVVTNHALLFTNLKMEKHYEYSLLPNYSAIIFDEAHTLENEAAEQLGLHITKTGTEFFLKKLFDPEKNKGIFFYKGVVKLEIRNKVEKILQLSQIFFKQFESLLDNKKEETLRFYKPGFANDIISEELRVLSKLLQETAKLESDEIFAQEIKSLSQKTEALADSFHNFCNMTLDNYVYWVERNEKNYQIELYAAPLFINEILAENLFSQNKSIILTSATLSVKNNLDYFSTRVGFSGGEKIILDTIFDYSRQMQIYISRKVPEPDNENYISLLCDEIKKYLNITNGKAFVLFTNFHHLNLCAKELQQYFEDKQIKIIIHGEGANRTKMLNEFKKNLNSVIFGATSFWSGVDIPEESLSNVIITKLPFLVPSHPLVQARCEKIEQEGKRPFTEYQLPEAILRLRQGIGRLIRTKTDSGLVAILDSRIITKSYGKSFLDSIPKCKVNIE